MQDYFYSPIFILGLPRSGTSMIAGALGICGAWTGSTIPHDGPENPKGFYEHTIIHQYITKQILINMECDPLGIRELPPVDLQGGISKLAEFIQETVEKDGYKHHLPWLYKDTKLTLLWPIFKDAFPEATWLIVKRDEEGFINSCLHTYFMKQHSEDRDFWKRFAEEYRVRLEGLKNSGADVLEISTPDIINGDFTPLKTLVSRLGLTYREKELKEFICPAYWHGDTDKR